MTSRIHLVRHGRSALPPEKEWLTRDGVRQWRAAYDAAGILANDAPPSALVAMVERAGSVVSSDMRRAAESARRVAPGREILLSPLMRETALEVPHWPTRLPLNGWEAVIHVLLFYHILRGRLAPPEEEARAAHAADLLASLAREHASVVCFTHGAFRRLMSARLERIGWRSGSRLRSFRHWSVWSVVENPNGDYQ